MTIDRVSWGYRRNAGINDFLTMHELITKIAETVSCGRNILIDVEPAVDGTIPPVMEEHIRQLGDWLGVNGEAIYASKPWRYQNDTAAGVCYTSKKVAEVGTTVYAIALNWPTTGVLSLSVVESTKETAVSMLSYAGGTFEWKNREADGIYIFVPQIPPDKLPSTWAWVFKLENLA